MKSIGGRSSWFLGEGGDGRRLSLGIKHEISLSSLRIDIDFEVGTTGTSRSEECETCLANCSCIAPEEIDEKCN